jgi:hypothetical protein
VLLNLISLNRNILGILMEDQCRKTRSWIGPVKEKLETHKCIDYTSDDESNIKKLADEIKSRIIPIKLQKILPQLEVIHKSFGISALHDDWKSIDKILSFYNTSAVPSSSGDSTNCEIVKENSQNSGKFVEISKQLIASQNDPNDYLIKINNSLIKLLNDKILSQCSSF